jgi:hypothetical protein
MANEPINLFARRRDPAGVARRLRELAPSVKIDGTDDDWRSAVVTFGSWWKKRSLTFTYDPAYHAEPNWSTQMNGMAGYFSRFPQMQRKEKAVMLPSTFRYSLSTQFSPDWESEDDPRLEVLYSVAELLDGVLFSPSALFDAHGRVLFAAGGEEEEDPDAVWPGVIFEFQISEESREQAAQMARDPLLTAPTGQRVARRALALAAVTHRAILEQEAAKKTPETAEEHQRLLAWIEEIGIGGEFEPNEWKVLQRAPGRLEEQDALNASWRFEGLGVLAWALGRFEIPPLDQLVQADVLWPAVGLFDTATASRLLESPELRPREEIGELCGRMFALHWRLVDYRVRPQMMDFADFARTCGFGPLDITGLPLVDGDLSLRGKRIDRALTEDFELASSIAQERHIAVNWLWEGPERYSEAHADT